MFEGIDGSNWFYEHRVGIYLTVSFVLSAVIAQHNSSNAEKAAQLEEKHLSALLDLDVDAGLTSKQELAYFQAEQTALINDNLKGLGLTIAFFGGLFAIHYIL